MHAQGALPRVLARLRLRHQKANDRRGFATSHRGRRPSGDDTGHPSGAGLAHRCGTPHHTTIRGAAQPGGCQLRCGCTRLAKLAWPVTFGWYDSLIGFDSPLIHSGLPQTECPMNALVGFTNA
jgi:hypothetical protein